MCDHYQLFELAYRPFLHRVLYTEAYQVILVYHDVLQAVSTVDSTWHVCRVCRVIRRDTAGIRA